MQEFSVSVATVEEEAAVLLHSCVIRLWQAADCIDASVTVPFTLHSGMLIALIPPLVGKSLGKALYMKCPKVVVAVPEKVPGTQALNAPNPPAPMLMSKFFPPPAAVLKLCTIMGFGMGRSGGCGEPGSGFSKMSW